ncbi:hypothetical protein [Anaerobium acetethylicum]|uniref:Uncharacterized protein n=1 Tax=Anaerobium acetethylicum TaxID=1619234 RepID=A0A1D3TSC9_9FIRM|nr:hypothetical protein [Anaerobium acetethylicum]SCP96728.1 hypothetical protein SAMN05421730_100627 [Anaerobium acetethylicum]
MILNGAITHDSANNAYCTKKIDAQINNFQRGLRIITIYDFFEKKKGAGRRQKEEWKTSFNWQQLQFPEFCTGTPKIAAG